VLLGGLRKFRAGDEFVVGVDALGAT